MSALPNPFLFLIFTDEIISSLQSAGQDADSGEANFNEERRKNYEEKLDSWRKWNEGRQTELDDAIDGLNAKLQDLMVEFQHEADMLNKSWENPKVSSFSNFFI